MNKPTKNNRKINRFETYSKSVIILIMAVVVLVSDFVLTGAYHLIKYGTIHKFADRRALRERSPIFHHTLKKNGRQQEQTWGHLSSPLYTNSLGFKDRGNREVPSTSSNYRFLIIGDSFTEGIGYNYDQTFVGLLDTAIADHQIEVLNAAVSSYSPAIYFKKVEYLLETEGLDFDHLLVFLDISDIEDEAKRYEIHDDRVVGLMSQTSRLKDFVDEYTGLIKNLWVLVANIQSFVWQDSKPQRSSEERRYGIKRHRSLWTVDDQVFQEYGHSGLKKASDHMNLLYQLLQRHQKGLSIAVYPWPDQIIHKDLQSRQVTYWQEWANAHSVEFFNFFPSFISPESNPKETLEKYFIAGDVHWNEMGHRVMADELLIKLRKTFPGILQSRKITEKILQ